MKKGFTMIELIFVIVILGILASVAIPRLAATREDAEISATVANLRTLLGDINSYYVVKGGFGATTKWKDITNVPLKDHGGVPITNELTGREVSLYIGGDRCIGVRLEDRVGNLPARIQFYTSNNNVSSVCQQVREAEPIKAYTKSEAIKGLTGTMAIGSNTKIY
ncbi:type II secretion system protein [Campylobacter sp.]|uniref:type II secretion system protein n=1 Tax=Campylobacter sp. TaxID=205 RepID=UPI002A4E46C9|nr:type II secretion system protein [Campylobacter sp.]MDD7090450.1 type II secretion system protein [Campylobacteraceae bacterium]MDY5284727.1 type II secretion system protein [Campylobacter sp.]